MNIVATLQYARPIRRRKLRSFASTSRRVALGQGLVEYALVLMLIALVLIGVVTVLGLKTSGLYDRIYCGFARTEASCTTASGGGGGSEAVSGP